MIHLPPGFYNFLQKTIIGDGSFLYSIFKKQTGIKPGDSVIDIGCGTAPMAGHFLADGISYTGIDTSIKRIEAARIKYKNAKFFCGNFREQFEKNNLNLDHLFMMGVVHHLSDEEIFEILDFAFLRGCKCFTVSEPQYPDHFLFNPLGVLACWLDEGKFIRKKNEYEKIFIQFGDVKLSSFRWPIMPYKTLVFSTFPKGNIQNRMV